MPLDIDGFAVLGAIARKPDAFPALSGDIAKTARMLVVKQLKDKSLTIDAFCALADAIEVEHLGLVADALGDADLKSLLTKLDKQNAAIKEAAPQAQRKHLMDLASGQVRPTVKAAPAKVQKPSKPAVERAGNSKAMRARKKV